MAAEMGDQFEVAIMLINTEIAWLEEDAERMRGMRADARPPAPEPAPVPPAPAHLCSRCERRPRHFDDLCKRCANDLGVRPHGKVA